MCGFCFHPSCPPLIFQPTLLWISCCLETLPRGPRCILESRAPIRNDAHPNWHFPGHGRLACSQVPAALLRGLDPWDSFHHSLSAIHKQHISHPPVNTCTHFHPGLPLHIHIYTAHTIFYYIDISDFGAS